MKRAIALVFVLSLAASAPQAPGAGGNLPALQEKPWEGYFIGHERRGFRFGIGCDGLGEIIPLDRRGDPIAAAKTMKVSFVIEETDANGKVTARQIRPESLETAGQPTTEPETVKFHGTATGDAKFEVVAGFDGNRVELGGRITDPGTLKGDLQFMIRTYMREVYREADYEDRDFRKKVRDDEIKLQTVDGKNEKIEMSEVVDVAKLTGNGVKSMRMEMDGYEGRKFEFTADDGSAIQLENRPGKRMTEGFTMYWRADAKKDPGGNARFGIEIK